MGRLAVWRKVIQTSWQHKPQPIPSDPVKAIGFGERLQTRKTWYFLKLAMPHIYVGLVTHPLESLVARLSEEVGPGRFAQPARPAVPDEALLAVPIRQQFCS